MANNENLIPIPGRLHSVATEGHVAGADEIYDDTLAKDQATINSEVNTALGTGGTVDQKIAAALEDVAFIDDSSSSSAVVPSFDPESQTVHVTAQTLSEQQKAQVRENIGLGDVDAKINEAVTSEASQRSAADSALQSSISAEATRAQAAESSLSSSKANKATSLSGYGITDAYTKTETYTKAEVNNLITTPNQEYVTVTATSQTTAATDVLPATGAADTVYRVGNWDGSQYSEVDYTEYAWNGSAYIKLSTKSQVGEVYDISANHAGATYADLSAALGTNGANIPQNLRKGGMSVKYVQTSDNKYVKFFCTAQNFTTDVTKWQGVDDEPTAGSENLVKSGGVAKQLQQIQNNKINDFDENSIAVVTDDGEKVVEIKENKKVVFGSDKGGISADNTASMSEDLQVRTDNNLNEFARVNEDGVNTVDYKTQDNRSILKYWSDKKIVIVGDSHVEYPTGRATKNWVKQLSDMTGANIVNLGVSGTGYVAGVAQNDCFYQRILAHAPNNADFYLIHGGANDAMFTSNEIGDITDTIEDNTISGYVNAAFDAILSVNPLANFAVSTALPSKDGNEQNPNNRRGLIAQAIINICIYRGVPYIDMYHDSGLRPWDEAFRNGYYTKDIDNDVNNGEHPDENGNRIFLLPKYSEFFKKFLNMTEYVSTLIVDAIIKNAYVDTNGSIGTASNHAVAVYRINDMSRRRIKVLIGCTYSTGNAGCMCFYNSNGTKVGDYVAIDKDTIIENIPSDARTIKVTYKVAGMGSIENYKIVEIV